MITQAGKLLVLTLKVHRPILESLFGQLLVLDIDGVCDAVEIPPARIGSPDYYQADAFTGPKLKGLHGFQQTLLVYGFNKSHWTIRRQVWISFSLQFAVRYQFRPQLKTARIVECQNSNRCSSNWCEALDIRSLKAKMSLPLVTTRMKQSHYFSCSRVDTCYVGTFAKITAVACKCKIVDFVGAAVLFGDNVLNVMRQFAVLLRQAAILATILGTLANKMARRGIHRLAAVGFQVTLGLELQD